jgi:hypothetical protein
MRTTLLVVTAWLLGGCMGTAGLEQRLRGRQGELMYLRQTRAVERVAGTVSIDAFAVEHALPAVTTVRRTGGWVVPLVLINVWKGEYECSLGAAQIANDWPLFAKESLVEDLRRGARHALVERGGDLRIDVRITKVAMKAPVVEGGHIAFVPVAGTSGKSIRAGPVDAAVEGEVVARRGGQEVLRKIVAGSARTASLRRKDNDFDAYAADFTTAMIEGLSLAVKDFNGAVVDEVNRL